MDLEFQILEIIRLAVLEKSEGKPVYTQKLEDNIGMVTLCELDKLSLIDCCAETYSINDPHKTVFVSTKNVFLETRFRLEDYVFLYRAIESLSQEYLARTGKNIPIIKIYISRQRGGEVKWKQS